MMKTRNLIGMIAFCLFALAACTPSKESGKTLTVLSWNVWHGGHSKTYSGKGCEGTIDILKKSEAELREIRGGEIAMIFQDSLSALNPVYTVGNKMVELIRHMSAVDHK